MCSRLLKVGAVILLVIGSAHGEPCDGYPVGKTWTAGGSNMIHESGGSGYPGWEKIDTSWADYYYQDHPVTVDSLTAQRDRIEPKYAGWALDLMYTTEDSGWTMTGGNELSFSWQVHISEPGTHYPLIQTGYPKIRLCNGAGRLELTFEENVTGVEGCVLSGWVASRGTITAGGKEIPNQLSPAQRYLPMTANEWHVIRVDLHANGSFDAWVDDGGSDWKHVSGTTSTTSDRYVRFGLTDSSHLIHEFSTACVAWGEGAAEIPSPPPGTGDEEICDNDDVDDDNDGDADCADSDCDCSPVADDCRLFVEILDTFNVVFVGDSLGLGDIPPDWERDADQYLAPVLTDEETGTFTLHPESPGPSQSVRMRIGMDQIPNSPNGNPPGCGSSEPECLAGTTALKQDLTVEDIVTVPVDWSRPVTMAVDVCGSDLTTDGQWESFITFDGYTGTATTLEWGNDGHPLVVSPAGFLTAAYALDPGQAGAADTTLSFGVRFDFNPPASIPPDKTDIMFFENVRILYHYDPSAAILTLDTSAIQHDIRLCETLPHDVFTVANQGGGVMTYTITDDADWLSVTPENGSATDESDPITIHYDISGLGGQRTATITVSSPEAFWSPKTIEVTLMIVLSPPDYDCDGDIDQSDFGIFQVCLTGDGQGPTIPGLCANHADYDGDGDVDELDIATFEGCASGPDIPFDPDCLNTP